MAIPLITVILIAETFAGINFRVSIKKREMFDKNFYVWRFLEHISRKNFREFKIREMLAAPKKKKTPSIILVDDVSSRNKSLLLKIAPFL